MKTKITLLILFITCFGFAQNGINYKALIKDNLGSVVANSSIEIQFTIIAGANPVYQEKQTPTTDSNGLIIVNIGEGTPTSGIFSDIDWASAEHFLKVEVDTGSGFIDLGTTQFKTVPYALTAKSSKTNAIVTFPKYLDLNYSDFSLISGNRVRIVIEFNIQMDPSSFVLGNSIVVSGVGGQATGTFQWTHGNTRLVFTSNEAFTTIAPCFSGGLTLLIKGSGSNKALDIQGMPIDGNRDGESGGNYQVTFDIVC
jgi:hypothetical protein